MNTQQSSNNNNSSTPQGFTFGGMMGVNNNNHPSNNNVSHTPGNMMNEGNPYPQQNHIIHDMMNPNQQPNLIVNPYRSSPVTTGISSTPAPSSPIHSTNSSNLSFNSNNINSLSQLQQLLNPHDGNQALLQQIVQALLSSEGNKTNNLQQGNMLNNTNQQLNNNGQHNISNNTINNTVSPALANFNDLYSKHKRNRNQFESSSINPNIINAIATAPTISNQNNNTTTTSSNNNESVVAELEDKLDFMTQILTIQSAKIRKLEERLKRIEGMLPDVGDEFVQTNNIHKLITNQTDISTSEKIPPPTTTLEALAAEEKKISNATPSKKQPNAYNIFMKDEIQRVRNQNPLLRQKEAFRVAANNWTEKKKNEKQKQKEDNTEVSSTGSGPNEK